MADLEAIIVRFFRILDKKGRKFNLLAGLICAVVVGISDIAAPNAYSFSLLYLLPITFTTWFAGKHAGLFVSVACTAFWAIDHCDSGIIASTWNILSAFGLFCVVSVMLARIRLMWETESQLSRTDPLTGVMNVRAFTEVVEYEISSLQRQGSPFSVAYLDLDNFKEVNDRYGHRKGDELLKTVVMCLVGNLRETDLIARMGGDEFTIFFPATNLEASRIVMLRIREHLLLLSEENGWPITFSMGVLTCTDGNCSLDEIISTADTLMYEVKNAGKNDVRFANYE
jgi:diguanylate cyclase (GGDEF)-like protein